MIKFLRWTGRVLFVLGVVGLVVCGLFLAWFANKRSESLAQLDKNSRIVRTALGEVELATAGDEGGTPVLILHGTPGGYDQGLAIGAALAKAGNFILAPSRPGYLRTPISSGFLLAEQADAMAALLDVFQIPDAAVVGLGAGAVVAAEMAVRHPGRVKGVVLISPPTAPVEAAYPGGFSDMNTLGAQVLSQVGGDLGAFVVLEGLRRNPTKTAQEILKMDTDLPESELDAAAIVNTPGQSALLEALVQAIYPLSPRESGTRNDLLHLRMPQPLAYEKISCPVLVLSGGANRARGSEDPGVILAAAPDVKSEVIPGAGSLVWFGSAGDVVEPMIESFIQNLPPPLPAQ